MTLLASQPFKAVYLTGALSFELLRLPLFLVKYLVGFGRQHPEYTYRQAISVRLVAAFIYHLGKVSHPAPLSLKPGAEKERFVVIKPARDSVYQGPLRSVSAIKPVEIGASWYPAPLTAGSDKSNVTVNLHIHGGAFVMGDGRMQATGYCAKLTLKHTTATHVFAPQYRLSTLPVSNTSNPFPAALQDSLTSYLYLVNDLKIAPKDIFISGDSAGGNLAISLLRYIAEYGSDLGIPNPSAAVLWSPWINPADTSGSYVYDNDKYPTDYLTPSFTKWGTTAYAGLAGTKTLEQAYISHKNRTFKTEVPIWVNTGDGEVLYYDDVEWAGKFKAAGNDVTLDVEKHVPHDIVMMGRILGFDRQATNCAKRAGEWLREKTR